MLAPEARAVRMPSAVPSRGPRMADDARPVGRPRPPVPPPAGPRTSAAPFAAVPSPAPEREALRPSATALDERPPVPSVLRDIPTPAGPPQLSQPVPELPPRAPASWADDDHRAPWSTGRGEIRAPRDLAGRPEARPFVERRASRLPAAALRPSAGPAETPVYGDWTKPSGPGRIAVSAPVPPLPPVPPAPLTSAIPDRDVAPRRGDVDGLDSRYGYDEAYAEAYGDAAYDARLDDRYDDGVDDLDDRVPSTPGPVTGTVVGGRAAQRAEREAREAARVAAEAERRRRNGTVLDDDEPRRPRRLLTGLVAIAAVAAGVLGVYTVTTPDTEETSAGTPVVQTTEPTTAPTSAPGVTAELPELDVDPADAEVAPVPAVRVPVTVLNATTVDGLAADISAKIKGQGWKTVKPGGYPNDDVAATTVFYTKGNEKQRQAAEQLVEQFPQLEGPVVRFFEVPATIKAPGLVVVAAGDWKP